MQNPLMTKDFKDTGQEDLSASVFLKSGEKSISIPKVKRMSITLTGDAVQHLEFLSQTQNITQNEALKKAIATEVYIRQSVVQGTKVLLQKPDGEIREVVFR